MENLKTCISCKHEKLVDGFITFLGHDVKCEILKCTRSSKIEMVYGEKLAPYLDCNFERENALRLEKERCGYQGP